MRYIKILLFILIFNFIFGPRFKVMDILLLTSFFLFGISVFYFFITKKKLFRKVNTLVMLVLIGLTYSLIILWIYQFKDTTSVEFMLKFLLYLGGAYFLVEMYYKVYRQNFEWKLCDHIFLVGVINAIFTCIMYVSNNLRAYLQNVLAFVSDGINWNDGLRVFDISMGGEASSSVVFSVLFLLGLNLLYRKKKKIKYILGLIFIFGAIFVTGRSGLVLVFLGAPLYYFTLIKRNKTSEFKFKKFKLKDVIALLIVLSIICGAVKLIPQSTKQRFSEKTVYWAFEQYFNYKDGNGFSSTSMNKVFHKMYFIPEDTSNLLFGSSNYGRKTEVLPYIPSDVGYVRTIFALGIIGLILIFLPYVYLIAFSYKTRHKCISSGILLYYTIVTLIFNFKELHYMPRGGASILLLLFICSLYICENNKNNSFFSGDSL